MNYALHYIVFIQWYIDSDGEFLPHVKFFSLIAIAKHLYDSADVFCYHVRKKMEMLWDICLRENTIASAKGFSFFWELMSIAHAK